MDPSLPEVIERYFAADARGDVEGVVALFTADAVVTDEGESRRGTDGVRSWRQGPASAYQYTVEILGAEALDAAGYVVSGRIEGNFPGGTAELRWFFVLDGDRIRELRIAP